MKGPNWLGRATQSVVLNSEGCTCSPFTHFILTFNIFQISTHTVHTFIQTLESPSLMAEQALVFFFPFYYCLHLHFSSLRETDWQSCRFKYAWQLGLWDFSSEIPLIHLHIESLRFVNESHTHYIFIPVVTKPGSSGCYLALSVFQWQTKPWAQPGGSSNVAVEAHQNQLAFSH